MRYHASVYGWEKTFSISSVISNRHILCLKAFVIQITKPVMESPANINGIFNYLYTTRLKHILYTVIGNKLYCSLIHTFHAVVKGFVDISIRICKFHSHFNEENNNVS